MKFELSTENIVKAVRASVLETVNLKPGQEIRIEFTNGRGTKGVTATAEIVEQGDIAKQAPPTDAPAPTTTASPKASVERVNGKVVSKAAEPEAATPEAGNEGAGATPEGVEAATPTPGLFGAL